MTWLGAGAFLVAAFLTTRSVIRGWICDATCYRYSIESSRRDKIGMNDKMQWLTFLVEVTLGSGLNCKEPILNFRGTLCWRMSL